MRMMNGRGWSLAIAAFCEKLTGATLVFGFSAVLAAATVRQVSNFELDGRPVLVPSVQKMELGEGTTALPAMFTAPLPDGETLIAEKLEAKRL